MCFPLFSLETQIDLTLGAGYIVIKIFFIYSRQVRWVKKWQHNQGVPGWRQGKAGSRKRRNSLSLPRMFRWSNFFYLFYFFYVMNEFKHLSIKFELLGIYGKDTYLQLSNKIIIIQCNICVRCLTLWVFYISLCKMGSRACCVALVKFENF